MDEMRVLPQAEIVRRLSAMRGEKHMRRPTEVTLRDVAKWMGLSRGCVRGHAAGAFPVNEAHQISYSALFALLDAGCLQIEMKGQVKSLVRVEPPKDPPKKPLRAYIDFPTMRLKAD